MRNTADNLSILHSAGSSPLFRPGRCGIIFAVILSLHGVFLFGPLLWFMVEARFFPPKKETAFKVKLGDNTPSVGPVVGPPERLRPSPEPPVSAPPAPEPPVSIPPAPEPVVPKAEPPVTIPKPKPKPKAKPKAKPKQQTKPKAKPKAKPKQQTKPKTQAKAKPSKKTPPRQKANRRPRNIDEAQRDVYRPTAGRNTNSNVPIGSRDAAQFYGKKPDHGTPQGGLTADEQAYQQKLGMFLKTKWSQPSKTLLGDTLPSTTIEISIAADGRMLSAKIIKSSGNRVMDESVKRMISILDRLPAPINGRGTTIQFEMRTEE